MERVTFFADVILPLPVSGTFTYRVPFDLNGRVKEGLRVVVQFGSRKIYTALVLRVHEKPPGGHIPKYILSVLDETPVVTTLQQNFWRWLASYYLCNPGEVMNAAMPSALKLASESKVTLNPLWQGDATALGEKELLLLEALQNRKTIAISEVSKIIDQQKVIPVIKTMIEKGVLLMEEELHDRYKPRTEVFIKLGPGYDDNDRLREVFDRLEKKARKQLEILMTFLQLSKFGFAEPLEVMRAELLKKAGATAAQLDGLYSKGILVAEAREVSRFGHAEAGSTPASIELTPVQQEALDGIRAAFRKQDVVLLHGVTSSGKTELYIKLIEEMRASGKQVLYLLPEIALTTQIISRLRKYFGDSVGVYHSRFNEHEKVEIWNSVLRGDESPTPGGARFGIILGARSALFLPFRNLGLVIVDEEHDSSFKQSDPAPRYNGRDAAVYLAHLHGAKTLLGSATPSIESYFNAEQGKYALVRLTERFAGMELPQIRVVNLREELRRNRMKSHFSSILLESLTTALANHEQSILFQNRRGFSLRLQCDTCHWMPSCVNCDVTLVYHKKSSQLRCHYCGYVARVPDRCPECQGTSISMKGFGTEKVEEELAALVPGARIARMDLDTTRSKHSHEKILREFEERKIDILVGTQMVTKGLDFDHVSTVCILNADNMLSYPDFRAQERSYQLMAQVSGRSGRKNKQGNVIIQTFNPGHMIIRDVVNHNYLAMYNQQMAERRKFHYPPFYRLILLKVKHREADLLNRAAEVLAKSLRKSFGNRILGPEFPLVGRIMNLYIKNILVKIEREASAASMKEKLMLSLEDFRKDKAFGAVRVVIDVDPL